jgi:segregation and condensation protein A
VREQADIIVDRLRRQRVSTIRALIADCDTTLLIVARFLALLELYRETVVAFEQITPLGDLTIRWTGTDDVTIDVTDEFDVERDIDELPAEQETEVNVDE